MTEAIPVDVLPSRRLTPMQRSLWTSQRRHPRDPVQNMALLTHLDGAVDVDRFFDAFEKVVAASDVLRTRVVDHDGATVVHVDAEWQARDTVSVPRRAAESWAQARVADPIDLTVRGYDSALLVHEDGTQSWYLALHHVITDAASSALVFGATARAYETGEVDLPSFYRWAAKPEDSRARRSRDHWTARRPADPLGGLYRPVGRAGSEAKRIEIAIDEQLEDDLQVGLLHDYRMISSELSWSALLTTATTCLIRQLTGVDHCSVGLPVHNRTSPETLDLIGPLMEVFPVDVGIETGASFRSLHRSVGRAILATLANSAPGSAPPADHAAVVNVIPRAALGDFGSIPASTTWVHSGVIDSSHLLRVQLTPYTSGTGVHLALDVNRSAAEDEHLDRVADHFTSILRAMVEDPDRSIGSPILTRDETVLLRAWETGPEATDPPGTVVDELHRTLARSGRASLRQGSETWVGSDLWARVVATARWLESEGVGPGGRVGIEMPRSADAVVAILATLAAGGSFVPIDPSQPANRRHRLAELAECALVLAELPRDVPTVSSGDEPPCRPSPEQEAYVLFTSGSTGEPKGVPITHGGLARYLRFAADTYVSDGDPLVVPLFSALGFDLTITSLFLPLVAGGELVVFEADAPSGLAELARDRTITWCKATPSHLELLRRLLPDDHRLRTVVIGGEALTAALVRRLLEIGEDIAVFNEYGPTEAVVGCMVHLVDPAELDDRPEVPIGRPAPGVTLRVVGPELERVPIGSVGELCVAHDGLTSGYLQAEREAHTTPFVRLDGRRFYRTGDLVRLVDPETLVFVGRRDEQLKVGGVRLEPGEVEEAILAHPAVAGAVVRPWSPSAAPPARRCVRCGLPSNVPGVTYDSAGVCGTCLDFDRVAPQAQRWFRSERDLVAKRNDARRRRRGRYDCLHLLSGGKDSTYALYRLVELGFEPYALTLDNGYISDQAKENIARSVEDLGLDHDFVATEAMNAIFRDSLERHSDVCHGCYKAIYTLAVNRAVELGIPVIVTGLSRGQLFETRLIPRQFDAAHFDPDAIDAAVIAARKAYHRADDVPNRLLDTSIFATDDVFDELEFIDFYRYVDVELSELLGFLSDRAPWVRPHDTGRSTNCLINAAGIHAHLVEQGHHNYAIPYAWDVRLGHKTRDQAIDELDDRLDLDDVSRLLESVGYDPSPSQILTAWIEPRAGHDLPTAAAMRSFLAGELPAYAVPQAFVRVDEIPLTQNGKLDVAALPPPERTHRASSGPWIEAETELEATIVSIWERALRTEPIGRDDDFFALGGDSLAALEMMALVNESLDLPADRRASDALGFEHRTPRELAAALTAHLVIDRKPPRSTALPTPAAWTQDRPPPLSDGELSILYDQSARSDDLMYNVARLYRVAGAVDAARFGDALRTVAARHVPLSWSFGATRRPLEPDAAVEIEVGASPVDDSSLELLVDETRNRPFDLDSGPLTRCLIQPLTDGSSAVLLVCHHVSVDEWSFEVIWSEIDTLLSDRQLEPLEIDYPSFALRRQDDRIEETRSYWQRELTGFSAARLRVHRSLSAAPDGFVSRMARVSPQLLRGSSDATGFAVSVAALAATMRRYSEGDAIEFGMLTTVRDSPAAEALVGYLLNTVPVCIRCGPDDRLGDLTDRTGRLVARHLAHRSYPGVRLLHDRRADGGQPADLDVLLSYNHTGPTSLHGVPVEQGVLSRRSSVTDLTFFVEVAETTVTLSLEHRGTVLDGELAALLLADFDSMLEAAIRSPDETIGAVELPSARIGRLIGPDVDAPTTILPEILGNVDMRAATPAVVCDGDTVTWAELGRRSAVLADRLRDAGVVPGDHVVVEIPRSVDLITAVLAILRVGAAYVPIDPTHPSDRRTRFRTASNAVAAVEPTNPETPGEPALAIVPLGESAGRIDGSTDPLAETAYVIFTSGSTGRPNAVPVGHRQLAASTSARRQFYDTPPERFLVVSSASFDSSVAGIFWTLVEGGTIVMPTDAQAGDPAELVGLIESAEVTDTLMVPTLYQAVLERARPGPVSTSWPRRVIVAGESCSRSLVDHHLDRFPSSELVNEYGPTETAVWATAHRCRRGRGPVPIGAPIPGAWIAVVDDEGRALPPGMEGELIIGGAGVVEGYLDDDTTTSARFGSTSDGRCFRTGDRAVVVDAEVRFLGRIDHQINVGGVRIEPEEIERSLDVEPTVGGIVVTTYDPRSLDALVEGRSEQELALAMRTAADAQDPGAELRRILGAADTTGRRIVAHIEPAGGSSVDLDAVRARAVRDLAAGVRPSAYRVHSALPRSPNGKLDRAAVEALPIGVAEPTTSHVDVSSARDDDATIELVAAAFARVLGVDRVNRDHSFFELGGHSLLALELVYELERELDAEIGVSTVFERPTPAALATSIRPQVGESSHRPFLVPIQPSGDKPPIFGVHVLGVDCEFYRPLAERLGLDQPVFGLGQPTSTPDTTRPTEVVEVARLYAAEIARCSPTGPIVLAAVSLGSVVAFELAQQLRHGGRDVALVAFFDAVGPDVVDGAPTPIERVLLHVREFVRRPPHYVRERTTQIRRRLSRRLEIGRLAVRRTLGLRIDHDLLVRGFVEENWRSQREYTFRPYPGSVLVFKAGDDPFTAELAEHEMGWGSVVRGSLDVVVTPGEHLSILAEPNVEHLARRLAHALARTDRPGAARGGAQLPPVRRQEVEEDLRVALAGSRFGAAVARWTTVERELTPDARTLVERCDRATRDLATAARSRGAEAVGRLAEAGLTADLAPVPPRLQYSMVTVSLDDLDEDGVKLGAALAGLAQLGYRIDGVGAGSSDAPAPADGWCTLIGTDDATTRLRLRWSRSARMRRPLDGGETPATSALLSTPSSLVAPILEIAEPCSDDVLVDLGCGDGRVLIEAARAFGCRGRGVESDPGQLARARANVRAAGLDDRVEISAGDARSAPIGDGSIVFVFLPVEIATHVVPDVLDRMAPGGRIVAHEQLDPGWPIAPDRSALVVGDGFTVAHLWRAR